ncbi:TolC family protein [Flavihumibacter rivuli]|uniref:TolC family protein n=1 Tax=Flavihumibacter rivuli TaxID=2838156 RepID=UPI001BDE1C1E|nr:TolC family protein [Flavihumibacter rivuli]ULQ57890.1 TolC family protein [Flavihumibacter rivuli]
MKKLAITTKKIIRITALSLLLSGGLYAQSDTSTGLSLQQCVDIAFKNNLELKQTEIQAATTQVSYKQSKDNLLPSFNGFVEHGLNQGRSIDPFSNSYLNQNINYANWGLNGGIVLFSGLANQNNIRQQRFAYQAGEMDVQQQKDNLTLQIIVAYLQVLSAEDQLVQIGKQVELSRKQVERLTILNEEGTITPSQLYDLKGQLANDEVSLVNTRNQLEAAKLQLSQLMNQPYDSSLKLQRITAEEFLSKYEGDPKSIYQTALDQLALVKAATLRKESAEFGVKTRKSALWPTLSLNGGLFTNYSSAASTQNLVSSSDVATNDYVMINGSKSPVFTTENIYEQQKIAYGNQFRNNYSTNVNLTLRVPILNAMQNRNLVTRAKLDLKNATYVEQTVKTRLQQAVEQAWVNMTATYNRYNALLKQVDAFQESFRVTETRFNEGVLNSVDYLVARTNLDRANISLIIARYEYVFRTRILDYYQGKPLW